jgi:nanoRNase/pAp phosphatase (c-di-AMP/oligoRNAs hydrolase)
MSEEQLELLLEAASSLNELLILPHNDPDPDAIAGAVGLRYLLAQTLNLESRIAFKGIIGRAENRALVRYLNHPLEPLDEPVIRPSIPVALIDTQPGTGNNPWAPETNIAIVIDHHPWRKTSGAADFADVRPAVGAVATILLEYLRAAAVELPSWLATTLFYGIKTDTRGLSREVSSTDAAAYFYLQPQIDVDALAEIERAQVPAAYFKTFATTLERTEVYDDTAIAYVGSMEYPDLAAEIADLLLRLEQIEWVICLGVYQDSLLVAVRAPNQERNAGALARTIVGPGGIAGGHNTMAGGQIPLTAEKTDTTVTELKARALKYLDIAPNSVGRPLI